MAKLISSTPAHAHTPAPAPRTIRPAPAKKMDALLKEDLTQVIQAWLSANRRKFDTEEGQQNAIKRRKIRLEAYLNSL